MMSVWTLEPWSKGLMPWARPSGLVWTMISTPSSLAIRSRCSIIALNFHVVSTCSRGNGSLPGKKAFSARRSMTPESLPML